MFFNGLLSDLVHVQHPDPPVLHNLSDEDTERELRKNILARRFVGLTGRQFGPDFTTIWRFREALTRAGVIDALHDACHKQLDDMGFRASKGQIVDTSIVPAPRQPGSREENEAVRAGEPPAEWSEAKRRQKDVEPVGRKRTNRGILATRTTSRWMRSTSLSASGR